MRSLFFIAVIIFSYKPASSQQVTFLRTYLAPSISNFKDIRQLPNGGYLLLGEIQEGQSNAFIPCLLRTDSLGNVSFIRTFGSSLNNRDIKLAFSSEGNAIVAGLNFAARYAWWVVVDSLGHAIDSSTIALAEVLGLATFTFDSNPRIAIAKLIRPADQDAILQITALSLKGDSLWTNGIRLPGTRYVYTGLSVIQFAQNGGIVVAGDHTPPPPVQSDYVFLLRTSSSGDSLWYVRYLAPWTAETNEEVINVMEMPDSSFATITYSHNFGDKRRIHLTHISKSGDLLFNNLYGSPDGSYIGWDPGAITLTSTGDFAIAYGERDPNSSGGCLLIADAQGTVLRNISYAKNFVAYYAKSIIQTSDSGFAIAGSSYNGLSREWRSYIAKTSSSGIITSIPETHKHDNPQRTAVSANFPNPFNSSTNIRLTLATTTHVTIAVYNSLGQLIDTIIDGDLDAGDQILTWNADNHPSGIYYCKMIAGFNRSTIPMVLLK